MERRTLASGSDLTWTLPHWLNRFLSIPFERYVGRVCVCVCTHAPEYTRACVCMCVNGWSLWMKSLLPELQTGGEIILKWRIPHPPTLLTHPPMPVGANLNESHQRAKWSSRGNLIDDNTVQYQLPPTDRKGCLYRGYWHRHTEEHTHTHTNTHLPVFFHPNI